MRKIFSQLLMLIHPSWHFYALILGIIGGIILGMVTQKVWLTHWLIFASAGCLFLLTLFQPYTILVILAFVVGLLFGNLRMLPELEGREIWQQLIGQEVTVSGIINEDPNLEQGTYKLKLNELGINEQKIAGTIYVQVASQGIALERSDVLTINGKAGAGFGTYVASFYRPSLQRIQRSNDGDIFARIKNWFAGIIRDFIPAPEAELGLGYLMGLKSLPEDLSETLRAVGMTHVVVASGTHLGILVGVARKLFGKISKFAGLLGALLLIISFVMIVGFTPSMSRAALVASLSMLVGYCGRSFTPLRLLSLVAAITLLFNPANLINLGWQLSFASFFGIMLVAPKIQQLLYGGKKPPWLASMLITSLATTLICMPILIYNFGTLSFLSFVANLIILPTLPYAMFLVFLTGILGFLPWCASLIAQVTRLLLDFHINLVNFLSQQKVFILELTSGDARIFLAYLPIIVFILWMIWKTRPRFVAQLNSS